MAIHATTKRQHIQNYLQSFNFKDLFKELLGWDNLKESAITITCNSQTYLLRPLAQKGLVKVYLCDPDAQGNIPSDPTLRQIESELTKHAYQHIIIYLDAAKTRQVWQWVKRGQGKSQQRLNRYYQGQSGELLAQKLEHLEVTIEEEERAHHAEMTGRTEKAFDVERITKRFFDRFKLEHAAFLQFIQGISSQEDREWYASLMLNRLMFVYFIQRKGFLDSKTPSTLDGDTQYLSTRLRWLQEQRGENQFHTFYRHFLLTLFHDGLSKRRRTPELEVLLGNVPYLNGGLFDMHTLERSYPAINIPDEAFEKLFAFFDEYDWHLDDRPLHNDREINPDVLGYIFEKYINQKQMGAYYTKEDITEYISKNTIVPFIFDAAEQKCLVAFTPDGPVWSLLRVDPDRYIYDAMKKGVEVPLPPEIEAGVHDVAQRGEWNKTASEALALPTEIWREVVTRRTRYQEVKARLTASEITSINDVITYNLDIVTFAEDAIAYCEGSDLLRAFYDSIRTVTVLDTTCGSGAFLFSALTLLERLYEACLDRMQQMIDERDLLDTALPTHKRQQHPKLDYFRTILREADRHPSRKYFIYKSIIINNLYGVDIMEEATEICKLRLFLKLVSQVNQFDDIEPLPDIDFNIRAGNTLVGFASLDETRRAIEGKIVSKGAFQSQMIFDDRLERIEQKAQEVERAFEHFRTLQTELQLDPTDMTANKQQIREKLGVLRTELDGYLASEYGIDRENSKKQEEYEEKFVMWQQMHQPFHWWVEFYGIMKRGGFDVIIGNPPWKEYSSVRKTYTLHNYVTEGCGNLHGMCTERALNLRSSQGWISFIVQLPLASSSRMASVRNLLKQRSNSLHVITFDDRPGKLFEGLQNCRSTIFVSQAHRSAKEVTIASTRYQRWITEVRPTIFPLLEYALIRHEPLFSDQFPKYANAIEETLFSKMKKQGEQPLASLLRRKETDHFIFYQEATRYWVKATVGLPYYEKNGTVGAPAHGRFLYFADAQTAHVVSALLNSTLFYSYFIAFGDCFHLSDTLVAHFPVMPQILHDPALAELNGKLMAHLTMKADRKTIRTFDGNEITYDTFYGAKSKPIIDEIDHTIAKHYGFTDEEADFIINYDIKYRMGQNSGDEDEE